MRPSEKVMRQLDAQKISRHPNRQHDGASASGGQRRLYRRNLIRWLAATGRRRIYAETTALPQSCR
jgi:hypothetical protein